MAQSLTPRARDVSALKAFISEWSERPAQEGVEMISQIAAKSFFADQYLPFASPRPYAVSLRYALRVACAHETSQPDLDLTLLQKYVDYDLLRMRLDAEDDLQESSTSVNVVAGSRLLSPVGPREPAPHTNRSDAKSQEGNHALPYVRSPLDAKGNEDEGLTRDSVGYNHSVSKRTSATLINKVPPIPYEIGSMPSADDIEDIGQ